MGIRNELYKGSEAFILENEYLKIVILKSFGGKVASIYYKKQNFEVLFQPTKDEYVVPSYGDSFEKYDTSGWDEMYPTIEKCEYPFETKHKSIEIPDHGELWSMPWTFIVQDDVLKSFIASPKFDYVFTRYITINKDTIHVKYQVENINREPLYGLWAFHGLLACDEYSEIMLKNVGNIINVHESTVLGEAGTVHNYPLTKDVNGKNYSLNKINSIDTNKTEKFYVNGKLVKGEAAITLNKGSLLLTLNFPESKIPYLGVWINEGGFKNEYNCALEPTNGFYDSVKAAKENNKIAKVDAGDSESWFLDIALKEI